MTKVEEAVEILRDLGMPIAQQNERSALTLLALLDVRKKVPWAKSRKRTIRIHDIMRYIEDVYGRKYAENTRETIRRQTLHQFEQGGIAIRNPDDPARPTNSPNNVYQISDDALEAIQRYGTYRWPEAAGQFQDKRGRLVDIYDRKKQASKLEVNLPKGPAIHLSPGKHNVLQRDIIERFVPRFSPSAVVLYVGDTAHKMLHINKGVLRKIGLPMTQHDKLPDVVLFDRLRNTLLLIEAVTAHGPLSPKRRFELEKLLSSCKAVRIYVSAFPDFKEFKKHATSIAWETEIWIAESPDHMIHFNGPKFFTLYQ